MATDGAEPTPGISRRSTNRDQLLGKAVKDASKGCLSFIKQIFVGCFTGIKDYIKPNRGKAAEDEENKRTSHSSQSTQTVAQAAAIESLRRHPSVATHPVTTPARRSSERPTTGIGATPAQRDDDEILPITEATPARGPNDDITPITETVLPRNPGKQRTPLPEPSEVHKHESLSELPQYKPRPSSEIATSTDGAARETPPIPSIQTTQDYETLQAATEATPKQSELDKNLLSDELTAAAIEMGSIPLTKVKTRRPDAAEQPASGPSGPSSLRIPIAPSRQRGGESVEAGPSSPTTPTTPTSPSSPSGSRAPSRQSSRQLLETGSTGHPTVESASSWASGTFSTPGSWPRHR